MTEAYAEVMKGYIQKYGRPRGLYVDKAGIFRVNRSYIQTGGETQFGRMMRELDIELICAHSSQAKGRVERLFGTLQDRLVKEMRLLKISNIEEGNKYLGEEFWNEFNGRWSCLPKLPENVHRPEPDAKKLDRIVTLRERRKVSKSLDFSYQGTVYQIQTKSPNRLVNKTITVFEGFDKRVWAELDGIVLQICAVRESPRVTPIKDVKTINSTRDVEED